MKPMEPAAAPGSAAVADSAPYPRVATQVGSVSNAGSQEETEGPHVPFRRVNATLLGLSDDVDSDGDGATTTDCGAPATRAFRVEVQPANEPASELGSGCGCGACAAARAGPYVVRRTLAHWRDVQRGARRSGLWAVGDAASGGEPAGRLGGALRVAEARGGGAEALAAVEPLPPFPRKKLRVMAATRAGGRADGAAGDARQFKTTVRQVNEWLRAAGASEAAQRSAWWRAFVEDDGAVAGGAGRSVSLTAAGVGGGATDASRRRKARALNQYFTRRSDAERLVAVARAALREAGAPEAQVFIEAAAGDGAVFEHFPVDARRIGVEVDAAFAAKHGWVCADFLATTRESLGIADVRSDRVVVVTNPPFVEHRSASGDGHSSDAGDGADAGAHGDDKDDTSGDVHGDAGGGAGDAPLRRDLACRFAQHALELGDTAVLLLPARFGRAEQRAELLRGCARPAECWVAVDEFDSCFDLGGTGPTDRIKEIRQPSVILVCRTARVE